MQTLFFGYGANRNFQKIKQIIGREPLSSRGALLENYALCFQNLDQIPEFPREFLKNIFGDGFKAYTLKKGQGLVCGILWELASGDFDKLREWEFIGSWRELVEVQVKTAENKIYEALTEKAPDIHPVAGTVDGLSYKEFSLPTKIEVQRKVKEQDYYTKQQLARIKLWLANQANNQKWYRQSF